MVFIDKLNKQQQISYHIHHIVTWCYLNYSN